MLLSAKAEINLCSASIKYYENLGYKIPRTHNRYGRYTVPRGTKIVVDVKDLPFNSSAIVSIQCDHCFKIYEVAYAHYNKRNHNGKTYCHSCAGRVLNSGENNYAWRPDIPDYEREEKRTFDGYDEFIKTVLARDNYTCQCCKSFSGELNVHHLNGYNWFIDGRIDPNNAITLCKNCHKNFHSIYGNGNNTKEQFEEWLGYTIECLSNNQNLQLPTTRQVYCIEENRIYDGVKKLAKEWNINNTSYIYDTCNHKLIKRTVNGFYRPYVHYTVNNKHLLWYDEYLSMSEIELKKYILKTMGSNVVCTTTNQLFSSITNARKFYGESLHISECCNNRTYIGTLNDGTLLSWMFFNDFLKLNKDLSLEQIFNKLDFIK